MGTEKVSDPDEAWDLAKDTFIGLTSPRSETHCATVFNLRLKLPGKYRLMVDIEQNTECYQVDPVPDVNISTHRSFCDLHHGKGIASEDVDSALI